MRATAIFERIRPWHAYFLGGFTRLCHGYTRKEYGRGTIIFGSFYKEIPLENLIVPRSYSLEYKRGTLEPNCVTAILVSKWPWHDYFFVGNLSVPRPYSFEYRRGTLYL